MSEQISVLHVDDDPHVLDLSASLFDREDASVSVLTAGSGPEGMEALSEHRIDCVVSDSVRMPDGESFVEAANRTTDAPIVLFTAKEWSEVAADAVAADVAEYVRKADVHDYETVIDHVLRLTGDAADPVHRPSRRVVGHHDFGSSTELGVSIVQAVDPLVEDDPDAPLLYDSIDADALASLFEPISGDPGADRIEVRFRYRGLDLVVAGDGTIALLPDEDER
jgi:CheY-like chemotaxis protein